jgi:hypothetical protein
LVGCFGIIWRTTKTTKLAFVPVIIVQSVAFRGNRWVVSGEGFSRLLAPENIQRLSFRQVLDGLRRQAEILLQDLRRRVLQPIRQKKGALLGKVALIEHQQELAPILSERLDRVRGPGREQP